MKGDTITVTKYKTSKEIMGDIQNSGGEIPSGDVYTTVVIKK